MNYHNKTMLITGAYRGIGRAIADYFANRGFNLIITYHYHQKETEKLKKELEEKYHINVDIQYLDLCQEESIENLYNYVNDKCAKIDILVNNAALSLDNDISSKSKDELMKVLETNIVGTFLMMKYFDKLVKGYIFNLSSTDGIDTGSIYSIDYNASKAGINSLTKTFSLYSQNTIISLCPNWVDTESTLEMDENYLKSELLRIKQKNLIKRETIPRIMDKCIQDKTVSGSIIRIDGDENDR